MLWKRLIFCVSDINRIEEATVLTKQQQRRLELSPNRCVFFF